ncbi:MAG: WecB/TagA/CpsF family glycosyltransferase [Anaerolineae bacterium]|nr:WecB/TagA/CpsF family glycosyltransferase [Anaerolineae bacterium]
MTGIDKSSKVNILGIGIDPVTMPQAIGRISAWVETGVRTYISMCTVHTVMECQRDKAVRQAVNGAGMATPDGMPLVWLSGWKSNSAVSRVYGPDLMLELCRHSQAKGFRHYFYGGAEGIPDQLAQNLKRQFPDLQIAGSFSPPFRPLTSSEDAEIIRMINATGPDIIWVGLGTPKQDLWMMTHRDRLTAPVLIGVGAAFDFHTGRVRQAPKWMQKRGLEWFYRLLQEPKRLWYRYLVYNPLFILLTMAQLLGVKRYSLD